MVPAEKAAYCVQFSEVGTITEMAISGAVTEIVSNQVCAGSFPNLLQNKLHTLRTVKNSGLSGGRLLVLDKTHLNSSPQAC